MKDLLIDSVKKCMISDLKVGAFLSGGIDSTLISLIMTRVLNKNINTFYIGFNEKGFDEKKYANEVAGLMNTDHQDIYLDDSSAFDVIQDLHNIYTEPFSDSSQIPTVILSKFAKRRNTVICSGDGGDELFGGYFRYDYVARINQFMRFLPSILSKDLVKFAQINIPSFKKFNLQKKFQTLSLASNKEKLYANTISHHLKPELLVKDGSEYFLDNKILKKISDLQILGYMKYHDLNFYLPNDILTKVDRASMYHSLEVRVPFLEKSILDYHHNQGEQSYRKHFNKKKILISIMKSIEPNLSNKFYTREKLGLGSPIKRWLSTILKDYLFDLLSKKNINKHDILNYKIVEELLKDKDNNGYFNNYFIIWDLMVFQQWCDHNL